MNTPLTLPDGYHLDNFLTLLRYIDNTYANLLSNNETGFIANFYQLSQGAQSLYVRLVMRKGPLFRVDRLNYKDIHQLDTTLTELSTAEFVQLNPNAPTEQLLELCLKEELTAITAGITPISKPMRKQDIIQQLMDNNHADNITSALSKYFSWIRRCHDSIVKTLKLLFFGNTRQDLSEFITQQLGIIQYETYTINQQDRFYKSRERVDALLELCEIQDWQDEHLKNASSNELKERINHAIRLKEHYQKSDPYIQQKYEKLITQLTRQLERLDVSAALEYYQHTLYPPSRERQARIWEKQAAFKKALEIIHQIESDPKHPDEPEKVIPLKNKILKKLSNSAVKLNNISANSIYGHSQHIQLVQDKTTNIETQVAQHLTDEEHLCVPMENQLFCGLFGLYFWDIIFSSQPDVFFNPYQLGPHDMWSPIFYQTRQHVIDERLALLNHGNHWQTIINNHFQAKHGLANYFVNWHAFDATLINKVFNSIPADHLKIIFSQILTHPGYYRSGFPDLVLFKPKGYQLWEVKGPSDSLQVNQKRWLAFFNKHQIPAGVIYVEWQQ